MSLRDEVRAVLRDVPDFPEPGILFRDISPLLADGPLFERVTDWMVEHYRTQRPTHVVGIESRGFLFGAPVAHRLGAGFVPARKPGKLPWKTARVDYDLEYGTDALEIHADAFHEGAHVLVVDDLLATGGTARAACELVGRLGGELAGLCVAIELAALGGRERVGDVRIDALVRFD
ncbi:MAG: adenine phosphoribosyltransferase [Planctomycetota bacterium]